MTPERDPLNVELDTLRAQNAALIQALRLLRNHFKTAEKDMEDDAKGRESDFAKAAALAFAADNSRYVLWIENALLRAGVRDI